MASVKFRSEGRMMSRFECGHGSRTWIGVRQKGAYGQQHFRYRQCGAPLVLQDVEANLTRAAHCHVHRAIGIRRAEQRNRRVHTRVREKNIERAMHRPTVAGTNASMSRWMGRDPCVEPRRHARAAHRCNGKSLS